MYKHLFVPVDGSELSHRAMDGSIALAAQLGARITGFVVEPDLPLSATSHDADAFTHRIKAHEARNTEHAQACWASLKSAPRPLAWNLPAPPSPPMAWTRPSSKKLKSTAAT